MKKVIKLFFGLSTLLTLISCGRGSGNGERALGYDQLKGLAADGSPSLDYKVSVSKYDHYREYMSFPFYNIPVGVVENYDSFYGSVTYLLYNLNTGSLIIEASKYGSLGGSDLCYAISNDGITSIINAEGKIITSFALNSRYGSYSSSIETVSQLNGDYYQSISLYDSYYGNSFTFYTKTSNGITTSITEAEFNAAAEMSKVPAKKELGNLKDIGFDTSNKYEMHNGQDYIVYNKNGNYIGTIPVSSWNLSSSSVFYGSNATMYYCGSKSEDDVIQGAKVTTTNSYCFEVDLENASWKYVEHLPFVVDFYKQCNENGCYSKALLTVTPLNSDRTKKLPYREIREVSTNIEKTNAYAYDSIIDYRMINTSSGIIAYSDSSVFFVKKTGRKMVEGVTSIVKANNDKVLYYNNDGKMTLSKTRNFGLGDEHSIKYGCDNISWNTFNGETVYSKTNGGYTYVNDNYRVLSNHTQYAINRGIVIMGHKVTTIGAGGVVEFSSNINVLSEVLSLNNGNSLWKASLEDGTDKYFVYSKSIK
ncbi:MAG: hypothetical protein MJ238_05445 [Bacilli bacterium]|nr:hypothetical protein [Bacilli bacterium]